MGIHVAPRISFRQMHDMELGKSLSYVFVLAYSASQILCFVLSCGIRVASKSNVDSIPSLNGVLILRCEYQSFMIIEIVMSILFTGVFLFKWIRTFQHPQDPISAFSTVFVHPSQVVFVFPPSLPCFLQGLRFLNRVSM